MAVGKTNNDTSGAAEARLHISVEGIVQGVNFRYYTRRQARNLLLAGWVRNTPDGSVEILAEGNRQALEQLLALVRKGPPAARVDRVTPTWLHYIGEFDTFEIVD